MAILASGALLVVAQPEGITMATYLETYVVTGYTKTGFYSRNVEATSAALAMVEGKKLIMEWMPGKRWQYWHAIPY